MTASELQDHIVASLVQTSGGTPRRWRSVVGPVRIHDLKTYPHCNWSVAPHGGSREIAEVERLLDTLRLAKPHVTEG